MTPSNTSRDTAYPLLQDPEIPIDHLIIASGLHLAENSGNYSAIWPDIRAIFPSPVRYSTGIRPNYSVNSLYKMFSGQSLGPNFS